MTANLVDKKDKINLSLFNINELLSFYMYRTLDREITCPPFLYTRLKTGCIMWLGMVVGGRVSSTQVSAQ